MYKKWLFFIFILMHTNIHSQAQKESHPLSFMFGTWKGQGVISSPEGKKITDITEHVYCKLGCSILVVEGLGTRTDSATGEKSIVHDAFGIITRNQETGKWFMRAYRNEDVIDVEVKRMEEKKISWEMPLPNHAGVIRFTTDFSEPSQWKGIGEYSRDGKEWSLFMETHLTKVVE